MPEPLTIELTLTRNGKTVRGKMTYDPFYVEAKGLDMIGTELMVFLERKLSEYG